MTRRCRICARVLTDPLWRARGVGRTCARRLGLIRQRQCMTVLVWSARKAVPGEGQMALFEFSEEGAA
jgi:hypothetical protein